MAEILSLKINIIEIKGQVDKFYAVTAGHDLASSNGQGLMIAVARNLRAHMESGQ